VKHQFHKARPQRNRITEFYHASLARSPVERDAFLESACGGDETLRQEVESLLQYELQSAWFLETPAGAVAMSPMRGQHEGASMVGQAVGAVQDRRGKPGGKP
jgi:hypothetical protein